MTVQPDVKAEETSTQSCLVSAFFEMTDTRVALMCSSSCHQSALTMALGSFLRCSVLGPMLRLTQSRE